MMQVVLQVETHDEVQCQCMHVLRDRTHPEIEEMRNAVTSCSRLLQWIKPTRWA